jgi:hypothetical protein
VRQVLGNGSVLDLEHGSHTRTQRLARVLRVRLYFEEVKVHRPRWDSRLLLPLRSCDHISEVEFEDTGDSQKRVEARNAPTLLDVAHGLPRERRRLGQSRERKRLRFPLSFKALRHKCADFLDGRTVGHTIVLRRPRIDEGRNNSYGGAGAASRPFGRNFWATNMSTPSRNYEITFRLLTGNSPQQKTIVQATDPGTARRIFAQQNAGCSIIGSPRELRESNRSGGVLDGFDE